jgi:hypothetical protein
MKTLETVLRNILSEQGGKLKKVRVDDPPIPIEAPDIVPQMRREIIKTANRTGLQFAQRHGAVLDAWSAFEIKIVATKSGQSTVKEISNGAAAVKVIQDIIKKQGNNYYGAGGALDKIESDGISKYMYIVGTNVSKRNRVFKYNVWVCNFHQLFKLSAQLHKTKNVGFYDVINDIRLSSTYKLGNIVVFSIQEAQQWFTALESALKQNNMNPKPENSRVLIPELEYLSTDYDPEKETFQSKTVEILTTADMEKYGYVGPFRGTARIDRDVYGNDILIPIRGSYPIVDIQEGTMGMFTGDFKNGAPINGTIIYDDGDTYSGDLKNIYTYIDPETGYPTFKFERGGLTSKQSKQQYLDAANIYANSDKSIILLLQQDIIKMLDNNPDWIASFSNTEYKTKAFDSFKATGVWSESMRNMSLLLNAQFLGNDILIPNTTQIRNEAYTDIPAKTRDAIIEHQTKKIPA